MARTGGNLELKVIILGEPGSVLLTSAVKISA